MMILQQQQKWPARSTESTSSDYKEEDDRSECSRTDTDYDCVPLDLSVNRLSPLRERDSGTESDDSGGRCSPEGRDCKAYKKSLMKRYCEFQFLYYRFRFLSV